MIKKKYFLLIILCFFISRSDALEIKSLVVIDNANITNYDFIKNIELIKILEQREISKSEHQAILSNIIDTKIKELELKNFSLEVNKQKIEKKVNSIFGQKLQNQQINPDVKKLLIRKIEIEEKWNRLILNKFKNKLEININEINEIAKLSNLSDKKKEDLIMMQKNKKINIISKTYFNEVKSKYLIKIVE